MLKFLFKKSHGASSSQCSFLSLSPSTSLVSRTLSSLTMWALIPEIKSLFNPRLTANCYRTFQKASEAEQALRKQLTNIQGRCSPGLWMKQLYHVEISTIFCHLVLFQPGNDLLFSLEFANVKRLLFCGWLLELVPVWCTLWQMLSTTSWIVPHTGPCLPYLLM